MTSKNSQKFSDVEYCLSQYFSKHIAPVMASVQSGLQSKRADETESYNSSAIGLLTSLADDSHMVPGVDTSSARLQLTGKWNSKTTDDYLDMVRKKIAKDKTIQKDIAVMAAAWRKAVIDAVGRQAYDNASKKIGADLSYAYIGHRLEEQMLGKMVSDRMPTSSVEYILRKASERSILGLNSLLHDSPADQEINDRIEARYRPTALEKCAVHGASFAMDVISMGGTSSWGSLAKMAGAEVVFTGLEAFTPKKAGKSQMSVEECISQGVFGSRTNVFDGFRKDPAVLRTWERPTLLSINRQLTKKLGVFETKPMFADYSFIYNTEKQEYPFPLSFSSTDTKKNSREGIPSIIAIGKEDEYRESRKKAAEKKAAEEKASAKQKTEVKTEAAPVSTQTEQTSPPAQAEPVNTESSGTSSENQSDAALSGWDGLLKTFGLDGLSGTGKNLGYVIAMLPDVLFGAFTGKTKNLGLEDNLIPIASVIAGLFIRNPLLKMTLIGLGGANLLNKAGKEALGSEVQEVQTERQVQYKQYADEPLNARIAGAGIRGSALVCTIDRVPCTISLPPATVAAYEAGALPLNTLANAVLARHDAMQQELAISYRQQYEQSRQQSQSTGIR